MRLRDLKYAERRESAHARAGRFIRRSTIGEIALDLVNSCVTWDYPPGRQLVELFRELLDREGEKQGHPRKLDAQEKAAQILAHNPNARVVELAEEVGVDKSSVSRWRNQPSFQAKVQRARAALERKANKRNKS
jgi:hypothetical protein